MKKLSKRAKAHRQSYDIDALFSLSDAVKLVKKGANAKFDESVDLVAVLGIDTRQSDQQVRGSTVLPNGTGKTVRVVVFARGDKASEAEAAGADIVGAEELMEKIQGGWLDFDRCLATPDMMAIVGRLGRVLGPRNLMPNPRLGTVTVDIGKAVADAKGGAVMYRAEKAGIVHVLVGKASFSEEKLIENIKSVISSIQVARPSVTKGPYLKSMSLSSTMGSSVRLEV